MAHTIFGAGTTHDCLIDVLKSENNYVSDSGEIKKWVVAEQARVYSPELIELLLGNEQLKTAFFVEVKGTMVFKLDKFLQFIELKNYINDSYTQFTQKVGLQVGGKFLSQRNEVELVFPYKDCVLEGGQTKEDQKRNEIFFNEVLAQDEITQLFDPKVLTEAKRIDARGEHPFDEFQRNEDINTKRGLPNNTITDNLVIRGNNLLALHTLKHQFRGKVKLIYIDPPYYFNAQKSEDTFSYNTNFKLSTWLTFMRNRLEIARELLTEDGAIFVQISDDGVAELHMLLKEVFNRNGENNFINKITVRTKSPSGFASVNPGVFETAEYILAFAKKKSKWTYKRQYVKSDYDPNYKWYITNKEESYRNWNIVDVFEYVASVNGFSSKAEAIHELGEEMFFKKVSKFALEEKDKLYQSTAIGKNAGQDVIDLKNKSKNNNGVVYELKRENHYDVYILNGREMAFYSKKIRTIDGENVPSILLTNIWTDVSYEGIAKEGLVTLKGGKKPERLIRRIVDMASNEGDIVLDFFSGTGTTAAVSYKMKRQFITCEQVNEQLEKTLKRLKEVAKGDNSPLSRILNWNGGGDFVYFELKRSNKQFIDDIESATTTEQLLEIWEQMKHRAFFRFSLDMQRFEENIEQFKSLSIEEQKASLCSVLDLNQLYVNRADMNDEELQVSDEEKRVTSNFYNN